MKRSFEFEVARRYLFGGVRERRKRRFIRFVVYAAIGGVTIGVTALLLALTITRGFSQEIERKIIDFGAHVQIENLLDAPLARSDTVSAAILEEPSIERVEPVVQELALIRTKDAIDGVGIWGIRIENPILAAYMVKGSADVHKGQGDRPGLILSAALAGRLGVQVGSTVTCFSMNDLPQGSPSFGRPRVKQFFVSGLFDTGFAEVDDRFVFVELDEARALLGYGANDVTRFDGYVSDIDKVDATVTALEERMGFPIMVRSIYEVQRNLFAWVNLQQSMIPLIIIVIVIVAAFNIIGALLMLVLEKSADIGVLKSMGATRASIRRVFILLGVFIGGIGILMGEGLALGLSLLQSHFGIIPLPRDTYYMDTAPVQLSPIDFLIVGGLTIVLCVLAAYAPARVASGTDPIRVIRFSR